MKVYAQYGFVKVCMHASYAHVKLHFALDLFFLLVLSIRSPAM